MIKKANKISIVIVLLLLCSCSAAIGLTITGGSLTGGFYNPVCYGIEGCALWLDAADSNTVVLTEGNQVERWLDKSGNNYHAETLLGARPFYVNGGITFNFNNVIDFDGSNQYFNIPLALMQNKTDFTYIIVIKKSQESVDWRRIFDFGVNTTSNSFFTPLSGFKSRFAITIGGPAGEERMDATPPIDGIITITWSPSENVGKIHARDILVATSSASVTPISMGSHVYHFIGKSIYGDPNYKGIISEILVFGRALTDEERSTLLRQLYGKWGGRF